MANIRVYLADGASLPRRASRRVDKESRAIQLGVEISPIIPVISPRFVALAYVSFNGEACFLPGGSVGVKLTGWTQFVNMFDPGTVLWIDYMNTGNRVRNYDTCMSCYAITGILWYDTNGEIEGRRNIGRECRECGYKWHFENV